MKIITSKILGKLGVSATLIAVLTIVSCGGSDDSGGGSAPEASFTSVVEGYDVTVTNTSTGADSYSWDFGDGSAALTIEQGTYTYAAAGEFTIALTATNANGEDTFTETITIVAPCEVDNSTAGSIDLQFASLGDGLENTFFDGFDGVALTVIENPDTQGNASCNVAQWQFGNGVGTAACQAWAGAGLNLGAGNDVDFATQDNSFQVDIWAPEGTTINLVLERNPFPDTTPSQASAVRTVTTGSAWQTMTFDFQEADNGDAAGGETPDGITDKYQNIIMYINQNQACSDDVVTYYIDNFKQVATAAAE